MKEVADEARGKEELHKQLVIRLSGFSSAFDNVSSIPVNSFLRYTSDLNVKQWYSEPNKDQEQTTFE